MKILINRHLYEITVWGGGDTLYIDMILKCVHTYYNGSFTLMHKTYKYLKSGGRRNMKSLTSGGIRSRIGNHYLNLWFISRARYQLTYSDLTNVAVN